MAACAATEIPKDLTGLTGEQVCKTIQDLHSASQLMLEVYKKSFK